MQNNLQIKEKKSIKFLIQKHPLHYSSCQNLKINNNSEEHSTVCCPNIELQPLQLAPIQRQQIGRNFNSSFQKISLMKPIIDRTQLRKENSHNFQKICGEFNKYLNSNRESLQQPQQYSPQENQLTPQADPLPLPQEKNSSMHNIANCNGCPDNDIQNPSEQISEIKGNDFADSSHSESDSLNDIQDLLASEQQQQQQITQKIVTSIQMDDDTRQPAVFNNCADTIQMESTATSNVNKSQLKNKSYNLMPSRRIIRNSNNQIQQNISKTNSNFVDSRITHFFNDSNVQQQLVDTSPPLEPLYYQKDPNLIMHGQSITYNALKYNKPKILTNPILQKNFYKYNATHYQFQQCRQLNPEIKYNCNYQKCSLPKVHM